MPTFVNFLEDDLDKLNEYDFFSTIDRNKFRNYMYEVREKLNVSEAVLVHGDFDMSHVFHDNGVYSGIIDFGEVRGNNPLYDLATFIAFSQDDEAYTYLMNGYTEVVDLSEEDLYAIELMGLFVILRFLGKKIRSFE